MKNFEYSQSFFVYFVSFSVPTLLLKNEGGETMDQFDEKSAIYEQMTLLIEERRKLTQSYFDLKERLEKLDSQPMEIKSSLIIQDNTKKLSSEIEYQKYMAERGQMKNRSISYSDISLKIASILKEAGRPLSGKEIFTLLNEKQTSNLSYENLTHNILRRMNDDSKVNVERAYRGYWQYRLHS
jgi:hypothetical protein